MHLKVALVIFIYLNVLLALSVHHDWPFAMSLREWLAFNATNARRLLLQIIDEIIHPKPDAKAMIANDLLVSKILSAAWGWNPCRTNDSKLIRDCKMFAMSNFRRSKSTQIYANLPYSNLSLRWTICNVWMILDDHLNRFSANHV